MTVPSIGVEIIKMFLRNVHRMRWLPVKNPHKQRVHGKGSTTRSIPLVLLNRLKVFC